MVKKKKKSVRVQMLIGMIMAILIIGSMFMPWLSVSTSILGAEVKVTYSGFDYVNVLVKGDDIIKDGTTEQIAIYAMSKVDEHKTNINISMYAAVATLALGVLLLIVCILGMITNLLLFSHIVKVLGALALLVGIIGGATCIAYGLKMTKAATALVSVSVIAIGQFTAAAGGLAAALTAVFLKK